MPKMTGDTLAVEIWKINPAAPIILSTGFNTNIKMEQLGELGVSEVLMKPVTIRDMAHAVRTALDNKHS